MFFHTLTADKTLNLKNYTQHSTNIFQMFKLKYIQDSVLQHLFCISILYFYKLDLAEPTHREPESLSSLI